MNSLRALAPATLWVLAALPAFAQAPQQSAPWPQAGAQQQESPWPEPGAPQPQPQFSPWPQAGAPQMAAPQQQQQEPPCIKEFMSLRDATAKRAAAIRAASERKATPQEACGLFKSMVEAENKFAKYAKDKGSACGIPDQIVKQLNENTKKTSAIRTQVCNAATQGPPRPAAPNLSDALSAPVTNSGNVKTGRGTFDTLTGTPLGRSAQ